MITDVGLDPTGIGASLYDDTIAPNCSAYMKVPTIKEQFGIYKTRVFKPPVCIDHLVCFF